MACMLVLLIAALFPLSAVGAGPNIILFVIDDLGWNDTGYQGAEYSTPTLDRLAEEGIRLKQYYVQPMCSPSRGALLAGKYAYHLGLADMIVVNGFPFGLGLEEVTFVERLKQGGYATHAVGKWDLGMHKWEYTPTYRGFDTFYGFYDADGDHFTHVAEMIPYPDPENPEQLLIPKGIDLHNNRDPVTTENGTYSTHLFTKVIQEAITSHAEDRKPFFVYGSYQAMHDPLQVPDQYLEKCLTIPYPKRRIFCGMMQALDESIKNVTLTLEANGFLDNTLIIVTTDNGGQSSEGSSNWPLRGNKVTLFEGGIRGLAFMWGKMLPQTDYDYTGLMHITDWYRTIVEGVAGLELSNSETVALDGIDMWQDITQNDTSGRNEILLQLNPPSSLYPDGQAAIRSGDWKLIVGKPDCPDFFKSHGIKCPTGWVHLNGTVDMPEESNPSQVWLFNMTSDPYERENVAEMYPDVVLQLKQRIEAYNSTHIQQMNPGFDPNSDPRHFGGVWTPWMSDDNKKIEL